MLSANGAFVELAQLGAEEQARGQSLDRWLGRSGVDLSVLMSNLRQRGAVRLFATTLRGEFGAAAEVEISATVVPHGEPPSWASRSATSAAGWRPTPARRRRSRHGARRSAG